MRDSIAESELTGRSLTMREYLEAVLFWIDRYYEPSRVFGGEPFRGDDDRRADLREHVQSVEARTMLERYGAGEDWQAIRASALGGRLE